MSEYGDAPVSLGVFVLFWDEYMTYQYLPIKVPECGRSQMPERLAFASKLVAAAWEEEDRRGNDWSHVYVTAKRGFATPGNPLNRPGWHADGFGTPDINYVWTDRYPTLFAIQPFENISTDHIDSIQQFTDQVDEAALTTYADRELLRLDPYVIHAAPEIPEPGGERSFFKVSFSNDRYDLLGNAHNYLLDYSWLMYPRGFVRNDPARAGRDSVTAG